jgi:hypothetical protein
MTREQIDRYIDIHESQRDFAKAYLDEHYYELEEQNKEAEWIQRYLYHKRIVEQLQKEKADDE